VSFGCDKKRKIEGKGGGWVGAQQTTQPSQLEQPPIPQTPGILLLFPKPGSRKQKENAT
jgi:hypothetical protein